MISLPAITPDIVRLFPHSPWMIVKTEAYQLPPFY